MRKPLLIIAVAATSMYMAALSVATVIAADPSPSPAAQIGQEIDLGLRNGTQTCGQLTDDSFDSLGDFYAERMMGSSADAMDRMMERRLGADGERQMHIAMGKRLSGCDVNAQYPNNSYAPAAWMMGGGPMMGYGYNMMDGWGGYGAASWIGMALFWLLAIGAVAAIVYLVVRGSGMRHSDASALDILKERYARGEINKDEFDQKRKDLRS